MWPRSKLTPRERYLQNRQRRQNTVFSVIISIMAVLVIVAFLLGVGLLPFPFGNDFSHAVKYADAGDIPCPAASATPVPAKRTHVQVLNATSQAGLATAVAQMFKKVGYSVGAVGNYDAQFWGSVQIEAGPKAVDAAYTVARYFTDPRIRLTDSTDATVTVVLGEGFGQVPTSEQARAIEKDTKPLTGLSSCLAVDPQLAQSVQSGRSATPSSSSSK